MSNNELRGTCINFRMRGADRTPECAIGHDVTKCQTCEHWQQIKPYEYPPDIKLRLAALEQKQAADMERARALERPKLTARQIAAQAYPRLGMQTLKRVWSFLRALASWAFMPRISKRRYVARLDACLACPHRKPGEPVGYCGKCGCGRNPLSELSTKAKMPAATCPDNRWAKR